MRRGRQCDRAMGQLRVTSFTCVTLNVLLMLPWASAVINPLHPFHSGYLFNARRRSDIKGANVAKKEAVSKDTKTADVIVVGAGISGTPYLLQ